MRKHSGSQKLLPAMLSFVLVSSLAAAQAQTGLELYKARKYQEAAGALQETLSTDPDNLQARFYLGLSYLELKKPSEAENELKRAASIREKLDEKPAVPAEDQIKIAIARACIDLKKYDEAQANLESAKQVNAGNPEAYLFGGKLGVARKDFQAAVPELEKAIRLDPRNAYAHYYAGIAYSNTGRPDKMAEQFQLFLKLAPDAPEAAQVRSLLRSVRK
jgi:tetratricopeptide (TPR) repeat protein